MKINLLMRPNFLQVIIDDKNMFSMKLKPKVSEFILKSKTLVRMTG